MYDKVVLKKDGFYYKDDLLEIDQGFYGFLNHLISVDKNAVFGDFINLINDENISIFNNIANVNLKPFLKETQAEQKFEVFCMQRFFEFYYDGKQFFENVHSFAREKDDGEDTSLTFSTIGEVLGAKFNILNDVFVQHHKNYELENIECSECSITLGGFIWGAFESLCFSGTPEKRDSEYESLVKTLDRLEKGEEELYELKLDEDGDFIFERFEKGEKSTTTPQGARLVKAAVDQKTKKGV